MVWPAQIEPLQNSENNFKNSNISSGIVPKHTLVYLFLLNLETNSPYYICHFLTNWAVHLWNSLSNHTVSSKTVKEFKVSLDKE